MTDARTESGRRPAGGDADPAGTAMPGREERTTDRTDVSASGGRSGQEEAQRMDDRDAAGQAVLVAGDGPGHDTDYTDGTDGTDGADYTDGTDAHRDGEQLMPREECGQLERRLQHAVTGFVDEPRTAVEEADRAVEEISARLTDAVERRRRTLRGSWQSADADRPGSADTEQLRLALRDYRELADRLLHM
ncbi:hypothetical protein ACIQVL_04080 [Streptomyces sp. NPDC090499]|uniref:hypothetical protein n=1 Tax=Streptomyces sp. NPDC090499 TaxID=3365965 RepID=UPI00380E2B25